METKFDSRQRKRLEEELQSRSVVTLKKIARKYNISSKLRKGPLINKLIQNIDHDILFSEVEKSLKKPKESMSFLEILPDELQAAILVELPYSELQKMCTLGYLNPSRQTTTVLKICEDDWFWSLKTKHDFSARFPEVNEERPTRTSDWKSEYQHYLKRLEKDLIEAIKNNNTIEVSSLLRSGVDPSANDNEAIRWASMDGHTSVVKLLLEDPRVDPSADDNQAIRWASADGYTDIVKLLLEDPRVDPSAHGDDAIRRASEQGHTSVIKLLLEDKRVDYNFAIRLASEDGHTSIVKLLLEDDRVDPSTMDNQAIRSASLYGRTDIVKLLLEDERVDPSARDDEAMRSALRYRYADIVKLLKKYE